MFATLLGALPPPPFGEGQPEEANGDLEARILVAIRAQEAAGLEPITDGRIRGHAEDRVPEAAAAVDAWRFVAQATDRAVKHVLAGPYSIGRRGIEDDVAATEKAAELERAAATERAAEAVRAVIAELMAAGCPLIEIEETDAHRIGDDARERELFREAHRRVTEGVVGTHLSLSIVGGSAWGAGLETILDAPYSSLAVDLIAGPDNWNLVTRMPGDRGVIVGALPARDSPADAKETLLWAARYAAASRRRGLDRVGLGSAGSWANLTWEAAGREDAPARRGGEARLDSRRRGARAAARPAGGQRPSRGARAGAPGAGPASTARAGREAVGCPT